MFFKAAVQSTEAFIMSPTLSGGDGGVLALLSALIGQNPPPTEAMLWPGFVCTMYKCTGVQNICTAV